MSLQIWLPLNGNSNNNGNYTGTITTTTTPSYVSSGKIGKAMSTGGFSIGSASNTFFNGNAMTFAFWLYPIGTSGSANIFGQSSMTAGDNRMYSTFQYPTPNDLHLSWQSETSSGTFLSTVISGFFTSGTWTHCAITYDGTQSKIYKNGVLNSTVSGTNSRTNFNYNFPIVDSSIKYLNDFRIYDEVLSDKQIKEIAKGLVLHYPLKGNCGANNNLVHGRFQCTSTNSSYNTSGTVSCDISNDEIIKNQGKTLTLSFDTYSLGNYTSDSSSSSWMYGRFGIHGCFNYTKTGASSATQEYPLANCLSRGQSGRVSCSWTIPTDIGTINQGLSFSIQNSHDYSYPASDNTSTWYIKNVKLEWGSVATSYVPSYLDTGGNGLIEYDASGNGYDGAYNVLCKTIADSPRYNASTDCMYNTRYLSTPTLNVGGFANSYSICWWSKGDLSTTMPWGFSDGNRLNYYQGIYCNTGDGGNNPFYSSGTTVITRPSSTVWHHFAFVGNGSNTLLYVDGNLYGTAATYKALTGSKIYITGWDSSTDYKFLGLISDFRVYATALSADDIKLLYNAPISVTNNGSLMTQGEFIEE